MHFHVAGDKRPRTMDGNVGDFTEIMPPSKRPKLSDFCPREDLPPLTNLSLESLTLVESDKTEEEHHEGLSQRLSQQALSNVMIRSARISQTLQKLDTKALSYRNSQPQSDVWLLRNMLAYNPNARRPTFDLPRPAPQEQLLDDFRHISIMSWCLIVEYSRICPDLSSRYSAVSAIQAYLVRNINNNILRNIYANSCYELKSTALETLTKITFSTLSNDPSVSRINGLLHARVEGFIGDAMTRVVASMSEDDLRHFLAEGKLFAKMKELQKLVGKLRWPMDGLEHVMEVFARCAEKRGSGMERRGSLWRKYSLKLFQKSKVGG